MLTEKVALHLKKSLEGLSEKKQNNEIKLGTFLNALKNILSLQLQSHHFSSFEMQIFLIHLDIDLFADCRSTDEIISVTNHIVKAFETNCEKLEFYTRLLAEHCPVFSDPHLLLEEFAKANTALSAFLFSKQNIFELSQKLNNCADINDLFAFNNDFEHFLREPQTLLLTQYHLRPLSNNTKPKPMFKRQSFVKGNLVQNAFSRPVKKEISIVSEEYLQALMWEHETNFGCAKNLMDVLRLYNRFLAMPLVDSQYAERLRLQMLAKAYEFLIIDLKTRKHMDFALLDPLFLISPENTSPAYSVYVRNYLYKTFTHRLDIIDAKLYHAIDHLTGLLKILQQYQSFFANEGFFATLFSFSRFSKQWDQLLERLLEKTWIFVNHQPHLLFDNEISKIFNTTYFNGEATFYYQKWRQLSRTQIPSLFTTSS